MSLRPRVRSIRGARLTRSSGLTSVTARDPLIGSSKGRCVRCLHGALSADGGVIYERAPLRGLNETIEVRAGHASVALRGTRAPLRWTDSRRWPKGSSRSQCGGGVKALGRLARPAPFSRPTRSPCRGHLLIGHRALLTTLHGRPIAEIQNRGRIRVVLRSCLLSNLCGSTLSAVTRGARHAAALVSSWDSGTATGTRLARRIAISAHR